LDRRTSGASLAGRRESSDSDANLGLGLRVREGTV